MMITQPEPYHLGVQHVFFASDTRLKYHPPAAWQSVRQDAMRKLARRPSFSPAPSAESQNMGVQGRSKNRSDLDRDG